MKPAMKSDCGIHDDDWLLSGLKRSDTAAFAELFDRYYMDLVMFCGNYICNQHACEDVVSTVFMNLWVKRETTNVEKSLKAYLLNSVKNRALNEIRHSRVKAEHVRSISTDEVLGVRDVENYILYSDMKARIDRAVGTFPEKIRESYVMYMEEGMKSAEIARRLNVTQRTVELRISKALSILRKCAALCIFSIVDLWVRMFPNTWA